MLMYMYRKKNILKYLTVGAVLVRSKYTPESLLRERL